MGVLGEGYQSGSSGLYGVNYASSGTNYGVYGYAGGGSGIGVYGTGHSYGGYFVSTSTTALYALASSTGGYGAYVGSPTNDGVHADSGSSSGNAAVSGTCTGTSCYGIFGNAGSSSALPGVYGESGYGTGTGVKGVGYYGVYGTSSVTGGTGVYAYASGGSSTGLYAFGVAVGVYGKSSSGTGVIAQSADAGGYGLHAVGAGGSSVAGYFENGNVNLEYGYSYYYNGSTCVGGYCTSDRRLKKNIEPLAGAIDRLLQLKGVTYEWNNPEEHGGARGLQTGFIAQDVEKAFPEWVDEKDGVKGIVLHPMHLAALEIESIRTLNDRAGKAEARADKAQAQLADLEDRVKALEAGHPQTVTTNFGVGGAGLGVFGLAMAGVLLTGRKKKEESR
jgi:hypothetical protein